MAVRRPCGHTLMPGNEEASDSPGAIEVNPGPNPDDQPADAVRGLQGSAMGCRVPMLRRSWLVPTTHVGVPHKVGSNLTRRRLPWLRVLVPMTGLLTCHHRGPEWPSTNGTSRSASQARKAGVLSVGLVRGHPAGQDPRRRAREWASLRPAATWSRTQFRPASALHTTIGVLSPGGRQVERPIDQRPALAAGVGQEHAQLTVVDPPSRAGVLTLNPAERTPFLMSSVSSTMNTPVASSPSWSRT